MHFFLKNIKIGESIAAILIWKMERICNIFGLLCFIISRKVKMQLKQKKEKICAVCQEGAVADWTSQKGFAKFLGTTDILAK